ncbi:Mammalian cell entry related domain protein [Streptomyces albus]|uniref:Mammalian cell entry related domain protein n=1 Tax=Streptomyces albus (strain ATCC 21838 / DSM 41398 / FERM P-419 / JCM 4703 / NBRC 107858) TaxID=1081613 RepID=A0A0B5EWT1_STRA4|nr:Mammalian cell entry related domain protein [Streptomyces albus]AOU81561.1 Mammalian cell entry related domain protein [Streptomyces albus]AYN37254.1 Mammalian cell entry related domain protein [Streptomyces albus]
MSPFKLGVIAIILIVVAGLLVMNRNSLMTKTRSGTTLKIHFPRGYRLQTDLSQVKVNYVPVGVVSSVDAQDDGSAMVSVKVDKDIPAKIRTEPTAVIRPTTLLGGNYFVDLVPGGRRGTFSGTIPPARTKIPVELDAVTQALQPSALKGLQHTVDNLDGTLKNGGKSALDRLLADAPDTLEPASGVLESARGDNPDTDLPQLVKGLQSSSAVLSRKHGQLDSVVTDLTATSTVLSENREQLSSSIAQLPSTLDSADKGLKRLDSSLVKLRDTADEVRPSVRELNTTLKRLDPVLAKAGPFTSKVNKLLVDTEPLVDQLVPVSRQADSVLKDVRGPVLDRVNGPIKRFILSPYKGSGAYKHSQSDEPMYVEAAGAITNLNKVSSFLDPNGYAISIQLGFGLGTAGGLPVSPEALLDALTGPQTKNSPQEDR